MADEQPVTTYREITPPSAKSDVTTTYRDYDPTKGQQPDEPKYSSDEYAEYIRGALNDPSIGGSVYRGGIGVLQGAVLDPIEAAGEPIEALGKNLGIDVGATIGPYVPSRIKDVARGARQIARQSPEGNIGRIGGGIASPFNKLVPDLPGLAAVVRDSGPAARALERVLQSAFKGGVGSTLVPQERDTKGIGDWIKGELAKAAPSAVVGSAFGLPSALARLTRRPAEEWHEAVRPLWENIPYVGRYARGIATAFGDARANTRMYDYILDPLRRLNRSTTMRTPSEAGWNSLRDIENHIGQQIDTATRNASWNQTLPSITALRQTASRAVQNLSAGALSRYRQVLQRVFNDNLYDPMTGVYRGRLDPRRFQQVTQQLQSIARNMDQGVPENREVIRALNEFRAALIDSASMSPQNRALWKAANDSWRRYALLREGLWMSNRNGVVPARNISRAAQRRNPYGYATFADPAQQIVNPAPQWNPADWAQRAGTGTAQTLQFFGQNGDQ